MSGRSTFNGVNLPIGPSAGTINHGLFVWSGRSVLVGQGHQYLWHEHIALVTFEQVAAGFGYSHLGIDLSLTHNFVLMRKLYRNFIYSYMLGIAKLENKTPGSIAKSKTMTNVWKRHKEVFYFFIPSLSSASSLLG